MSRFQALTGKQVLGALQRMGFESDGRKTVVPVHSGESIGPGLLSSILRQVQITRDELNQHL